MVKERRITPLEFWRELRRRGEVKQFLINIGFAALGGAITTFAFDYGPILYRLSTRLIGPHRTQVIIGIAVIAVGVMAHWFKRINQFGYGIVEVFFGGVSGFLLAFTMTPATAARTQWASLVACSYVVARGLNNMHDAKRKHNFQ
jgi:hypothetical protein